MKVPLRQGSRCSRNLLAMFIHASHIVNFCFSQLPIPRHNIRRNSRVRASSMFKKYIIKMPEPGKSSQPLEIHLYRPYIDLS